jgi:hypothetical protein
VEKQLVSFAAIVPPSGFRWIYRDPFGDKWRLAEPPDDWLRADYESARDRRLKPEISDRFFIAASRDECSLEEQEHYPDPGKRLNIPDLYLRFASEQPRPRTILDYANRFGLLRHNESNVTIRRNNAIALERAFDWELTASSSKFLDLQAEPASKWLREFELARCRLEAWSDLKERGDPEQMRDFLTFDGNLVGAKLFFGANLDASTGVMRSEMIASSLADMIRTQFILSITSNVVHRQCGECPTWFSVNPGSGRPEKEFCSNACRMRAYRRRRGKGG